MKLQAKLNKPWVSRSGDATEVSRSDTTIGIAEVGVVHYVKSLRAKFNGLILSQAGSLDERHIKNNIARPVEHVAAKVSESTGTGSKARCRTHSPEKWIRCSGPRTPTRAVKDAVRSAIGGIGIPGILEDDIGSNKIGTVTTRTREGPIIGLRYVERRSILQYSHAIDLPTTQQLAKRSMLVLVKRKLIDIAQDIALPDILVAVSAISPRIVPAGV